MKRGSLPRPPLPPLPARASARAAAALLLLGACGDAPPEPLRPGVAPGGPARAEGAPHPPGERWLVVFHDSVSDPGARGRALARQHGGALGHVYEHALKGVSLSLPAAAVAALERNPRVRYVEADTHLHPLGTQSPAPWSLDRIDQRSLPLDGGYRHWWSGAGVNLYVVDTGIEPHLPELGDRVRHGWSAVGDGLGSGDCHGHGTAVAGAAGGLTLGVARSALLWSVRISGDCVDGLAAASDAVKGIDWVAGHHRRPAVVNFSFAGAPPGLIARTFSRTVEDAVRGLVARDVLLVAGAGNSGADACTQSPARLPEALTVGATDAADRRGAWPFGASSNHGPCLDLWAPGSSVPSAERGGGSATRSGTSLATALTSGVAALLLEEDPALGQAALRSRLLALATSTTIGDAGAGSPHRLLHSLRLGVRVHGPVRVERTGVHAWTAEAEGGGGRPVAYLWEHRPAWGGAWEVVGTRPGYARLVDIRDADFLLRATVTVEGVGAAALRHVEVVGVAAPCVGPEGKECPIVH